MNINKQVLTAHHNYMQQLSNFLQKYEQGKNLSHEAFRKNFCEVMDVNVSQTTFRVWINGNAIPDIFYLFKLRDYFNLDTIEDLFKEY